MYLTVTQPAGDVTSLDLEHLGVWRLRFEIVNSNTPGEADRFSIALGIRYLTGGTLAGGTAFATIAAFPTHCVQEDLGPILQVQLPVDDRDAAKDRFKEAMKVLYNSSIAAKTVDELLPKGGALIDTYFDIKKALWGGGNALAQVGPEAKGSLGGYHWAITRKRFESCMVEKSAVEAPPPPGEEPETIVLTDQPVTKKKKGKE